MSILKQLFCKHNYKDTGKRFTFVNFYGIAEVHKTFQCTKCGKKQRVDHFNRKVDE